MITSGLFARPASSMAKLVVRSAGPPRSWVSRKTTFMTDRARGSGLLPFLRDRGH